ncbi:MAG: hypothetical protein KH328_01360 [Staphylococcus sp.]|nr:hypothetical protein [Staphylococcus sp.]
MSDKSKTIVKFNVQNVKFAIKNGDNWTPPSPMGTSMKISLEANSSQKNIFGDGKIIASIVNDKGKTGTLTLNNICADYEIAMGRKMKLSNGIADVKTIKSVEHCIYFETQGVTEDSKYPIAKTWLFGVTSTRPAESYDQNTDDVNESTFDLPLTIKGVSLKNAQGENYVDTDGNEYLVYQLTVEPGDDGYETFGDAVVVPTAN